MKLKALYFLLPLLAAAAIFTFCTKDSQIIVEEKQIAASDRGGGAGTGTACKVTVTVNYGNVTICGTNLNTTQCGTNYQNNPLFGSQTLNAVTTVNYTVVSPSSIKITANGATAANVTVSTAGGSITTGVGALDGDKEIYFDDNTCEPHLIR